MTAYSKLPAVRITAIPSLEHPNSGLQAMHFAAFFGDEVWVIPEDGGYIVDQPVRFSIFDRDWLRKLVSASMVRRLALLTVFWRMMTRRHRTYFIHSFLFAIPPFLLRRNYYVFIHGSDKEYLRTRWGRTVARNGRGVFGVGFGQTVGVNVTEIPNVFIPGEPKEATEPTFDFAFVLRNAAVKNPLYPIELAEKLGTLLDLSIVVVGVSSDELSECDRARLSHLREKGCRVEYVGRKSYAEVVRLMNLSRALLIPSHSEGLPKVLLEAMALGLHVLANRCLTFPPALEKRVQAIDLSDWPGITALIKRNRGNPRCDWNPQVAHGYLEDSHASLIAMYEGAYNRDFGFVPTPSNENGLKALTASGIDRRLSRLWR